ncbi:MAG TPA: GNAT family N-acetyltransferase [Methylocystis sp.]|nr:GNAT family N-acetyltransferase [Methylocystis sp.]
MFPDLTRDDIFRLETRRLWLRWPRASDAEWIVAYAGDPEVALKTAAIPHPFGKDDAEGFVLRAREANASGESLFLALTPKQRPNQVIGMISCVGSRSRGSGVLGFALAREHWGQGLMTEAAIAFVDLVFTVTSLQEIVSSAMPSNPASLRVQEKVGFVRSGRSIEHWPVRGQDVELETTVLKRGAAHSRFGERRARLTSA